MVRRMAAVDMSDQRPPRTIIIIPTALFVDSRPTRAKPLDRKKKVRLRNETREENQITAALIFSVALAMLSFTHLDHEKAFGNSNRSKAECNNHGEKANSNLTSASRKRSNHEGEATRNKSEPQRSSTPSKTHIQRKKCQAEASVKHTYHMPPMIPMAKRMFVATNSRAMKKKIMK